MRSSDGPDERARVPNAETRAAMAEGNALLERSRLEHLAEDETDRTTRVLSYRDLKVWAKGMDFATMVYGLGKQMPKEEQYRMTSQMLRSAASVPANIAEGCQRGTRRDYANFISIARGSLAETETFLIMASRVGLLPEDATAPALALADELSRMLRALRQKLVHSTRPPNP